MVLASAEISATKKDRDTKGHKGYVERRFGFGVLTAKSAKHTKGIK
jgi:hypothetical protein